MKPSLARTLSVRSNQGLAYEAAKTTSAVNMGVIVALMPLMSALLASLLPSESLSRRQIAAALFSLSGLTCWLRAVNQQRCCMATFTSVTA